MAFKPKAPAQPNTPAEKQALAFPLVERSVAAALMTSPILRAEMVQKYPGSTEDFFSSTGGKSVFRAIMGRSGRLMPSAIEPLVTQEVLDSDWHPQRVFDALTVDEGDRFWVNVETLRQAAKRRALARLLREGGKQVMEEPNIDVMAGDLSAKLSRISSTLTAAYNPTMMAIGGKYQELKTAGKLGTKVSTGIRRLDEAWGGGLQVDPGEFLCIAGDAKNRKTTLALNLIVGWHRQGHPGSTIWICNESSVNSIDLMCLLWAMEASFMAREQGKMTQAPDGSTRPIAFTRESVKYDYKDPAKQAFVDEAFRRVMSWNIRIYCAGFSEGNSGDYDAVMSQARADIEFAEGKRVVVDNFQGWRKGDEDDYAVMLRTVPGVDEFTAKYGCLTIGLSQTSREGKVRGSGGIEGRASIVAKTRYNDKETPGILNVSREFARYHPYFSLDLEMDALSGIITDGR